jgi:hypothetical protein
MAVNVKVLGFFSGTLPNGTKAEIFRKWDSIVKTHHGLE